MRIRKDSYKGKETIYFTNTWMSLYPRFCAPRFNVEKAGYFYERPQVNLAASYSLLLVTIPLMIIFSLPLLLAVAIVALQLIVPWGETYIHLPIKTGIDECESPRYGFYYHANSLVICRGKKLKFIHMPWEYNWIRTSLLLKDGKTWEHESKRNRKEFWREEYKELSWNETHPYMYTLKSGEKQNILATIQVKEMEWRQRWLKWTSLFSMVSKSIEIEFSGEVGERAGSWKGGTIGCSYELKKDETPEQCLRRMEREREFR